MKLFRIIISALLLATFAIVNAASSEAYTIDNVPNVRLQDKRQYTSDPGNLLTQAARDSINLYLAALEHETNIETAVVMLPSIGEADAFEFGHSLFRQWGIGKKKSNNGLLILYVEDQHTIRFVTGYGIEGTLTDALCKRIQQQYMVPAFKEGKRDLGMVTGVKAVCKTLKGEKFDSEASNDDEDIVPMIIFMCTIFVLFFAMVYLTAVRKRLCQQCGKRAMKAQSTDHYRKDGRYFKKVVYVCENCGKVEVVTEEEHGDDGTGDAIIAGSVLGSMFGSRGGGGSFGGGFGGGGFSGGSFGGGSSGGGGAGSSW